MNKPKIDNHPLLGSKITTSGAEGTIICVYQDDTNTDIEVQDVHGRVWLYSNIHVDIMSGFVEDPSIKYEVSSSISAESIDEWRKITNGN